jgi:hypothetical protein
MLRRIKNLILAIRINVNHAAYHRNMKRALIAQENSDLVKFQKNIYRAEDAWRKMVILIEQQTK